VDTWLRREKRQRSKEYLAARYPSICLDRLTANMIPFEREWRMSWITDLASALGIYLTHSFCVVSNLIEVNCTLSYKVIESLIFDARWFQMSGHLHDGWK
jgi:hypothetical protein